MTYFGPISGQYTPDTYGHGDDYDINPLQLGSKVIFPIQISTVEVALRREAGYDAKPKIPL